MLNNIDRFSEYFERDQVITRIFWIAYQTAHQATFTKNERRFIKVLRQGYGRDGVGGKGDGEKN